MSEDRREAILTRLTALATELMGEGHVFRNQLNVPENKLPAIQIFDADETPDESSYGRGRPARSPLVVGMTPELYVAVATDAKDIGAELNAWRVKVIKAVLRDSSLLELCHNGDVRYEGCVTAFAKGRDMTGEIGLAFTFNYVLRPDQL